MNAACPLECKIFLSNINTKKASLPHFLVRNWKWEPVDRVQCKRTNWRFLPERGKGEFVSPMAKF